MEVLVKYDEVYSKVAELRHQVEFRIQEAKGRHQQIQHTLNEMDGSTNMTTIESMIENEKRAEMAVDTLCSLLSFINDAAQKIQLHELMIKQMFLSNLS
ncbi:MAG: hypothetical protein FWE05_13695 [Defluviitaleaceae bacterium]|nr:hypothetical protein [Defluviitaleaceae bacterium]